MARTDPRHERTGLFKKLNLGNQGTLHVLDAPKSFESELAALEGVTIRRKVAGPVAFGIAFAVTQAQLDSVSSKLAAAIEGDGILWIAYPKGTSKKYRCEFNRDSGWTVLRAAGFDTVRQVAIDEDWSALRFRRTQYINS